VRYLGTGRDRYSPLDWHYQPRAAVRRRLPDVVDLRPHCPPVYDQLHLNSCSANALAAAIRFDEIRDGHRRAAPSRLFIYFTERDLSGVSGQNVAVSLRDGYRAIAKVGACPERMWPYDARRFRRAPSVACYRAARRHLAIEYYRIRRTIAHLRACLAERYPFVCGVAVHKSFLSRRVKASGLVPLPGARDAYVGGHAMLAVGYDHPRRLFIVRNSWGRTWGHHGYGYLPYRYFESSALAWDFWTMRRVS
jgi:C1A family cysteine protease